MVGSRTTGIGQGAIFAHSDEILNLTDDSVKRRSFSHYLTPSIIDPEGELVHSVSVSGAAPSNMTGVKVFLMGDSHQRHDEVNDPYRYYGVLLSPLEKSILLGSPIHFANNASARNLRHQNEELSHEEKQARAYRAGAHAVYQRINAMTDIVIGLATRSEELAALKSQSQRPSHANLSDHIMRNLFECSREELYHVADVIQVVLGLSDGERLSFLSYIARPIVQGAQSEKVTNWKRLLDFQLQYAQARMQIFNQSIRRAIEVHNDKLALGMAA